MLWKLLTFIECLVCAINWSQCLTVSITFVIRDNELNCLKFTDEETLAKEVK